MCPHTVDAVFRRGCPAGRQPAIAYPLSEKHENEYSGCTRG